MAAVLTTWIGILHLVAPDRHHTDRGVYVSVAERLLAGDTLYSGVYDNKEPLFYYFVAAQRALGSWAEPTAESMLIAIVAAATYFIAVRVSSQWVALAVSFIAVPIILTGTFYYPGFSELPGTALVLVGISASACGRPVLSGSCIGLLVFMKLIFVPVALVGVSCFLLVRRDLFETLIVALSAFTSAIVVVGVLLVRSELLPFLETIKLNIAYSQGNLILPARGLDALVAHVRRIGGWTLAGELAPLSLAIMLNLIPPSGTHDRSRAQLAIVGTCVSTLVTSLVVLSLCGLWDYHRQILYIPSIFAVLGLTFLLDVTAKRARLPTLGLVILTGYVMAGSPDPKRYIQSFATSYGELSWVSPESQRLLEIGSSGTYARFGWEDSGHAIGLRHWKLACPKFHQYNHDSDVALNKVFECALTSPTLLISANFASNTARPSSNEFVARMDRFVDRVEQLLNQSYSCDSDSGLRVCTRRSN
jgi:hypothetical protein